MIVVGSENYEIGDTPIGVATGVGGGGGGASGTNNNNQDTVLSPPPPPPPSPSNNKQTPSMVVMGKHVMVGINPEQQQQQQQRSASYNTPIRSKSKSACWKKWSVWASDCCMFSRCPSRLCCIWSYYFSSWMCLAFSIVAIVYASHNLYPTHKPMGVCSGTNQYWVDNGTPDPVVKNPSALHCDTVQQQQENQNAENENDRSAAYPSVARDSYPAFMLATDCVWTVNGFPEYPLPPQPDSILIPFTEHYFELLKDPHNPSPNAPGGIGARIGNIVYDRYHPIIKKDVSSSPGSQPDGVLSNGMVAFLVIGIAVCLYSVVSLIVIPCCISNSQACTFKHSIYDRGY